MAVFSFTSSTCWMLDCFVQRPFFCVLFFFFFFFGGGGSCNNQWYFPTRACIVISMCASDILCSSVFEIKTVWNPQPS